MGNVTINDCYMLLKNTRGIAINDCYVLLKNAIGVTIDNCYPLIRNIGGEMYIDAHNHLELYKDRLSAAINMIKEYNIITLGCSIDEDTYLFTKKLSEDNPLIIPCFGIHPWRAHENYKQLDRFQEYIKEARIIGEIGLDYYWVEEKEKYAYMRQVFQYLIEKASQYNKVTNIHTKGAESEIYEAVRKYNLRNPIIHWYSGPIDILEKFIDYGCYFTISVDLGYSKLSEEIVTRLPIDKILTETDGPGSLEWVNGQYGYPTEVKDIVRKISLIKGIPYEEVRERIKNNFIKAGDFNEYR